MKPSKRKFLTLKIYMKEKKISQEMIISKEDLSSKSQIDHIRLLWNSMEHFIVKNKLMEKIGNSLKRLRKRKEPLAMDLSSMEILHTLGIIRLLGKISLMWKTLRMIQLHFRRTLRNLFGGIQLIECSMWWELFTTTSLTKIEIRAIYIDLRIIHNIA